MTANQIAYWNYVETKRNNMASLAETTRSHQANENYNMLNLREVARSNYAREAENRRSNMANESIKREQNREARRSNQANEDISRMQAGASILGSRAQSVNAGTNAFNALTNRMDANTRANVASETARSNLAREAENTRSNLARERETNRSNVRSEQIKHLQLSEQKRSNVANETLKLGDIAVRGVTSLLGTLTRKGAK